MKKENPDFDPDELSKEDISECGFFDDSRKAQIAYIAYRYDCFQDELHYLDG